MDSGGWYPGKNIDKLRQRVRRSKEDDELSRMHSIIAADGAGGEEQEEEQHEEEGTAKEGYLGKYLTKAAQRLTRDVGGSKADATSGNEEEDGEEEEDIDDDEAHVRAALARAKEDGGVLGKMKRSVPRPLLALKRRVVHKRGLRQQRWAKLRSVSTIGNIAVEGKSAISLNVPAF